ncbi:MAG: universal stress protein [Bacteroidota bacterium]
MKKIIAALDGLKLSESTVSYALNISKNGSGHLVGVFLDDIAYHSYKFADLISDEGRLSEERLNQLNKKDEATRMNAIQLFKGKCESAGIPFSIHRDRNVALKDLLHESIYSDLLVIDRDEDFNIYRNEIPSNFIQELLADVECPVLVVPRQYTPVQKVILLYDGEPSSVMAVKMFSYTMFPFKQLPIEVVSAKSNKESIHLPDNQLMKEFMKRHFKDAKYTILKGDPEDAILTFLKKQEENTMVVLGAYRRSKVSRWFKPSMADLLMKHLDMPLYIAHNR